MTSNPPHSPTAEASTLGAMLLNSDVIPKAVAILGDDPAVFYDPAHRAIYSAVLDLYRDGTPLDAITLHNRLVESDRLNEAGGVAHLASLTDVVPTSANVEYYARIVAQDAVKRAVIDGCTQALTAAQSHAATADDVLSHVRRISNGHTRELLTTSYLKDWVDLADTPIRQVFRQGLPVGKLGVLSAEGGTGKSYLALELAISVAMGHEIIQGFTPTEPGGVLCLFAEDDDHVVSHRLRSIADGLSINDSTISGLLRSRRLQFINGQSAPILSFDAFGGITRTAAFVAIHDQVRRDKYRLVVVDPLVAWAGIPNENDNAAMQAVASALIDIAGASDGAVLALHHANKQAGRARDLSQGASRGASSLLCAARWVAAMQTLDERTAEDYGVPESEAHLYAEVLISKNSYAERSGQLTTLRRLPGGALQHVALRADRDASIAQAIAAVIDDTGGGLTPREIARGKASLAEEFRSMLTLKLGFQPTVTGIDSAIKYGITAGILTLSDGVRDGVGKPRKELKCLGF